MATGMPLMPVDLQIANLSNIITFLVGIFFLYLALKDYGNPRSLGYFKEMVLGMVLYCWFHEGVDIVTGTLLQVYMPEWIFGFWPVILLQTIGPVVFLHGAYRYNKEMFKSMGGGM